MRNNGVRLRFCQVKSCRVRAYGVISTNALNEMLKRVQHDKKKLVISNLFRNLEFGNGKILSAFVLAWKYAQQPSNRRRDFDAIHDANDTEGI